MTAFGLTASQLPNVNGNTQSSVATWMRVRHHRELSTAPHNSKGPGATQAAQTRVRSSDHASPTPYSMNKVAGASSNSLTRWMYPAATAPSTTR